MTTALIYLVVMIVVAAVVFLLSSVLFGRGEQLAPLPPGATPTRLPASDIDAADIRGLRFQQVLRGYKMSEVDWALDRLATELDALRDRVAELEANQPRPDADPLHPTDSDEVTEHRSESRHAADPFLAAEQQHAAEDHQDENRAATEHHGVEQQHGWSGHGRHESDSTRQDDLA